MINMETDRHMRGWMWVACFIDVACCIFLWRKSNASVCVPVFAAFSGGVLGFAIRDYRARVDAAFRKQSSDR